MLRVLSIITASLLITGSAIAATPELLCERQGSTRSFALDLDAYHDGEKQWAAVQVIQYPNTTELFYYIKSDKTVNGVREIQLHNPKIYTQADRNLVLRLDNKKASLEVFWIRGSTGFGFGGESGSLFYGCQ